MRYNVFVIDDEKDICTYIERILKKDNLTSLSVNSEFEALNILEKNEFDIILMDFRLTEMTGFELYDKMKSLNLIPNTLVLIMTAHGSIEMALDAIKRGCFDYIIKPFNIEDLIFRIRRGIEVLKLQQEISRLSDINISGYYGMIGGSDVIKKIFQTIKNIAPMDVTVLIEGDTGTGKELIAKAIYKESSRKDAMFIPINCGAISENLLESELFGYEKGAFTGANTSKFGLFEVSNNGTVFLDEINSLTPAIQIKILRFIETGEFIKVGGTKVMHSDVRLIAASNQDLEELVKEKKFRQDLYFRMNVMKITIPPLAKRKEDIPLLMDHFLMTFNTLYKKNCYIPRDIYKYFVEYKWEGNIRQLKNVIQKLVLINSTGTITEKDLPDFILEEKSDVLSEHFLEFKEAKARVVDEFEKKYFCGLMRMTGGNVLQASKTGNIDRKYLIEKLKEFNIEPDVYKTGKKNSKAKEKG